jgi:hypothetical protein
MAATRMFAQVRTVRLTIAMSGRETASEAPLLDGPLDCGVGRLLGQ